MSAPRSRRIDRRTAEQLLRGEPGERTGTDALSDLLTAASAPATGGELAGEQAALQAFRAAHPIPALQPRRRSMIGMLTVKLAAVAAGAVAVGGVAFAAATGALPAKPGGETPPPVPAPAPASHASETAPTSPPTQRSVAGQDRDTGGAPASPSLTGLCQAYGSGAGKDNGKALENPAFTTLITAAGGIDNVPGYCAGVLEEKHAKPDNTKPADKGPNKPHPGGPPATKPGH